jgi:hypothetical protein
LLSVTVRSFEEAIASTAVYKTDPLLEWMKANKDGIIDQEKGVNGRVKSFFYRIFFTASRFDKVIDERNRRLSPF